MADKVTQQLSGRPFDDKDLVEGVNRELAPAVKQLVGVYNRSQGGPTTVTGETYITSESQYWLADATSGAFDIYLPSTDQWSMRLYIKKIDPGVNLVTIYPDGPDTIEGGTKIQLLDTFAHAELWASPGVWYLSANTGVLHGAFSAAFSTDFET